MSRMTSRNGVSRARLADTSTISERGSAPSTATIDNTNASVAIPIVTIINCAGL